MKKKLFSMAVITTAILTSYLANGNNQEQPSNNLLLDNIEALSDPTEEYGITCDVGCGRCWYPDDSEENAVPGCRFTGFMSDFCC